MTTLDDPTPESGDPTVVDTEQTPPLNNYVADALARGFSEGDAFTSRRCAVRECGQLKGHEGRHDGVQGVACCLTSKCKQPFGHEGEHDAPHIGKRHKRARRGAALTVATVLFLLALGTGTANAGTGHSHTPTPTPTHSTYSTHPHTTAPSTTPCPPSAVPTTTRPVASVPATTPAASSSVPPALSSTPPVSPSAPAPYVTSTSPVVNSAPVQTEDIGTPVSALAHTGSSYLPWLIVVGFLLLAAGIALTVRGRKGVQS